MSLKSGTVTVNTDEIIRSLSIGHDVLKGAIPTALGRGGAIIEDDAKHRCAEDTGRLRGSITTTILDDKTVTVGSPLEYSIYLEYGTGIYAEGGRGRKTPWIWSRESTDPSKKWRGYHFTRGMNPKPFLRPAFDEKRQDCIDEVRGYLTDALREWLRT